jgi:L-lactate dehydrogenase complex protein LldE
MEGYLHAGGWIYYHLSFEGAHMKVALFVPCYTDALYPKVGIATLELLERLGCDVEFPSGQVCCGQPQAAEGDQKHAQRTEQHYFDTFAGYDAIVCPAGSCVKQIRYYMDAVEQTTATQETSQNTYELTEFIHDVLKVREFPWATFEHTVAIHNSCSSIRGLHLTSMSEWQGPKFNKTQTLLEGVKGITIKPLDRQDECCGFSGVFCVTDPAVSGKMGSDKIADYTRQKVEYVVSPDSSCMMHQSGIASREKSPLKFAHIAQVLNNGPF